ncbi:MAG: ABC transporter ATP-binding protein [Desulfatitalea sp.]|nr:ABC transporter ATP-binding protein [Desulfatitalea sp.]NNK01086.1 ABC transporter ATP-binding protein [Desulfatitalea sp.]
MNPAESNSEHEAPAIALDYLRRVYRGGGWSDLSADKVVALNNVTLSIPRNCIFGLVGESGSGKSTLARLIVRLEQPDRGAIRINGEDIARVCGRPLKRFRRRVQMIFQDPYQSLNPYHSVRRIVEEPLVIHRLAPGGRRRSKIIDTLAMVGIQPPEAYLCRYPHQLSGGQRQRVAIARAMVLDPDILVADEPTSMLDASISAQIFHLLADIQQRHRMTLLFITHSLAAAHYLCDTIAVMYRGHIVESGPARTVIGNPKHPYTQALLDALPKFGQHGREHRFDTLRELELAASFTHGCIFYSRCRRAQAHLCAHRAPKRISFGQGHSAACFFAADASNASR